MNASKKTSPFHRGELEIQARLGVLELADNIGRRFIRGHMPPEHQKFYQNLPYIYLSSVDQHSRPWASVLFGEPGFMQTPDSKTLHINARPICDDPLAKNLKDGLAVGLLGIEYQHRRRNRMTGKVATFDDDSIEIAIDQTFGNCPQYIQARQLKDVGASTASKKILPSSQSDSLTLEMSAIINKADHFFIATHYSEDAKDSSQGSDLSHRGGKPGFVKIVDDDTLLFPDFSGNNHFNTLGNIQLNPRAGLLFIDFDSGDLLSMTCQAEIIWQGDEVNAFVGAQRLIRLKVEKVILMPSVIPANWEFIDYSPSLDQTGSWTQTVEQLLAVERGNVYRNYRVSKVVSESDIIKSFYLAPEKIEKLSCHLAGQFLPVEILPPDAIKPLRRTYTISNAPNGEYFRLSIKAEPTTSPLHEPGLVSNYFHDQMVPGSIIRALSPRGKFTLDESGSRPVVLISAGVGVTPMISMLEQLNNEQACCGKQRDVWFIHAAVNGRVHAFNEHVRDLGRNWPQLKTRFVYSDPSPEDKYGIDYDTSGRINLALLKSILPLDDYDFYLCGPPPFMKAIFEDLKSINISDKRIHYEFFGSGESLQTPEHDSDTKNAKIDETIKPVTVKFAKSGLETTWHSGQGSLLELAESAGLSAAFSCRSGVCQTCSTRIIEGEVDYAEQPMVPTLNNEALICCSVPRSVDKSTDETPILVLDL